jgi:two-component system, LytTR family, sensor histidine kinase AlgZ
MFGWSITAAITAVALTASMNGASLQSSWRQLVVPFGIALLFTGSIVPLAALTMPRVMPAIRCRAPFPIDWVLLFLVMVALGVAGSTAAIGILWSVGYVPTAHLWEWFTGSLRTSIIMTLIFGMAISAIEGMRARLDNAEMKLRIKERDEADARRLAAEAQLASLEARVNPHFLFNTLNSIATLVHDNPAAAERMTTQLASLLRSSLDTSAPLVPVEEELAIVRAYLDIERVRFGERLRASIQASGLSDAARVPRLAVQTLVENSVKYAVSPRREGGAVDVRAAATPESVRIEVTDDGPGFNPAAVTAGHGLALVRARLAMAFGDRSALQIDSTSGRTAVTITIEGERVA